MAEQVAELASGFLSFANQVAAPFLKAALATGTAAPVAVAAPTPVPVAASLGLKVLLEPQMGGVIFRAASNTVATIYPVYASAKAIESKDTADDVQWLTYWTLYGSMILAEHLADQALGKVPFYYHAKFAALLWLQLPQTRGAAYLYNRYYKPAMAQYGPHIDAVLSKGHNLLINLYAMYKVPIEAAVALGLQAWKSLLAAVKALSEDKKAVNKSDAVKPHAA
ncbi:hypothetical protein CHLRE_17g696850v5 [Chlamydomonas reinhardtii]|uniref:HVA22-like protein n=1 Tax=Chlamydomonas reinhardtii TaxID=3055 RepID=A0A2K3CNN3_CHLRE|nr:uncharacterized protein CHLRE_17g696850v5 [Chlamydomonas reinhardtii]PNW69888.1 hypothetical protein CHLRE_17g696850v5 [Chlamydomonas reinhardtii]